jgi:4a-hydroxytetrahydrobiopterin dehydratase
LGQAGAMTMSALPEWGLRGLKPHDSNLPAMESSALRDALNRLPQWRHDPERGTLTRRFVFADFAQAFGFMTEMAIWSEKNDHHPHWFNDHRRVDVSLTTHDVGGLSVRDLAWAQAADAAAARRATCHDATPDGEHP